MTRTLTTVSALLIALVVAIALVMPADASAELRPYLPAEQVGTLTDPGITEASGLAVSAVDPTIGYTHNDSGGPDTVYAFAIDGGTPIARIELDGLEVDGVEQVDWEDMATGPGPDGSPWVYVADIGDNPSARPFIHLLGFPDPDLPAAADGQVITLDVGDHEVFVMAYEDGPRDAETLLVHPISGQVTIVTKTLPRTGTGRLPVDPENGFSGIYTAPNPLQPVNLLTRQADVDLRDIVSDDIAAEKGAAAFWATAGDIAPDGSRVVIRTLFEAFEFPLDESGDVAAALNGPLLNVALPAVRQGESITYTADSTSLLAGSEGADSPLHLLAPVLDDDEPTT